MGAGGVIRYMVTYRIGGRKGINRSAGTYATRAEADARCEEVDALIAGAKPVPVPSPGQVYFIRAKSGEGLVKIGSSRDPAKRLAGLQTSNAVELEIAALLDGGRTAERRLHHKFAAYRVRGEWFEQTPELLEVIRQAQSRARRWNRVEYSHVEVSA